MGRDTPPGESVLGRGPDASGIRLGMRMVIGMPQTEALRIEQQQPFHSMEEFRQPGLKPSTITWLARADVFASLKINRQASRWQALLPSRRQHLPLFNAAEDDEPKLDLPAMDARQEVFADYQTACR